MTIAELGAIGEFVGSVAVLLTLLYLAIQVRMTRRESRATLLQHRSDAARSLWLAEATNPALTKAVQLANRELGSERPMLKVVGEGLEIEQSELAAVVALGSAHFIHRQTMFLSDLSDEERKALDNQIVAIFSTGINRIWFNYVSERSENSGFDPKFVEHVQTLFDERGI